MSKRIFTIVALLVIASMLLTTGCKAKSNKIKIAILAPLSGPVPTFGVSTRDGALLAIEEWNKNGGVLGNQIEVIIADSQCTPDPAQNAANKVIDQDKVHYIIGEVCSKASIAISNIAEAKKVVQISPTSTNPQVTKNVDGSTKSYVFRACFTDDWQGGSAAKYAIEKLGAKTAYVLFDQGNDYVAGLAEYFAQAFAAKGGTVLGKDAYTAQDTDFSAILAKVANANPDILYVPDYYPAVNLIGNQAKEKGVTAVMMGGDGWDSPQLDLKAVDGGYFSNHYAPDEQLPIVQNFIANYKAKYGSTPDALAVLAYDATNMMLNAIKQVGSDNPSKVKDILATGTFESVSGTIKLDANHNPVKSAFIMKIKDGVIKLDTKLNP
jgi:branched-chain amino acid transport system substrate-binding protein